MVGHGAKKGNDGLSAAIHPVESGCENIPTEMIETRMPVRKLRFELVPNSGGPGTFRGGLATEAEWEALGSGPSSPLTDKRRYSKVEGLAGGHPAPYTNHVTVFPGTEEELVLGKRSDVDLKPGDRFIVGPAGGGGWGDPLERELDRVLEDVIDGYVTADAAREQYGVVLSDPKTIDVAATKEQRRSRLRAEAGAAGGADADR
jgi:N-methylhydantoinase B